MKHKKFRSAIKYPEWNIKKEHWYNKLYLIIQRFVYWLGLYQRGKILNNGQWQTPLRNGIPLVSKMSPDSSSKHKDWWRYDDTPEATEEQTRQCFKELEEKGKLKIPAGKKGGVPVGVCPDADEFREEYKAHKQGMLYEEKEQIEREKYANERMEKELEETKKGNV